MWKEGDYTLKIIYFPGSLILEKYFDPPAAFQVQ